ncbi:MAG TPA: lipopolysaccharide biosynthesis protein, partial [Chitinivibrionales bacterium]
MTHPQPYSSELIIDQEKSLGPLALRSSFFVLIAKLFRYGFVFLSQIILMNLLNPADFGLMRYVTIVLGIVNLINEAGLGVALVQKKQLHENEIASSFSLIIAVCLGLYAIVFLSAPSIASFFGNARLTDLIRIGGLSAPLGAVSIVHRSLMQRRFRFGALAVIEASSALTGSITAIVLGYLGFGVWSLVWSVLVYNTSSSLVSIIVGNRLRGNFIAVAASMSLWVFGASAVVQRIIDYGTSNVDFLVVGKLFGEHTLGIYSMAFSVISLPQMALGAVLVSVAIAIFSRVQDDDERLRGAFLRLTRVTTILSIPYFILLFNLAPELMHAVSFIKSSDKWVPAAPFIKILAPMGLLYCLNSFPSLVWIAKRKIKLRIVWAAFSLVTMIAAILGGCSFGVIGICAALCIRAVVFFPVTLYVNYRSFQLRPRIYLRVIAPPLVCGAAACAALWGLGAMDFLHFEKHPYAKIVWFSLVCLALYGFSLKIALGSVFTELFDVV